MNSLALKVTKNGGVKEKNEIENGKTCIQSRNSFERLMLGFPYNNVCRWQDTTNHSIG